MATKLPVHCFRMAQFAMLTLTSAGVAIPALAQEAREGLLQIASSPSEFPPRYVLVDEQNKHWNLELSKQVMLNSLLNLDGRFITVHPSPAIDADKPTDRIHVAKFEILKSYTADQRDAAAQYRKTLEQAFRKSQLPLGESESDRLANLATAHPDILDSDAHLRHDLLLGVYHRGVKYWKIRPDGSFEKFRWARSADSGGVMRKQTLAHGTLSDRQMMELAFVVCHSEVLTLPEKIDDTQLTGNLSSRYEIPAYSLSFGDFQCSGTQAFKQSSRPADVHEHQSKLSAVAMAITMHIHNSLRSEE